VILRRYGDRFTIYHVFAFLIFNIGVRSRNRYISILSVARKNFIEVERIIRSLSEKRLKRARAELKESRKTANKGIY